jgi:hypothetical protein
MLPKAAEKPGSGLLVEMFISLVLGMLAQFAYRRFSQPRGTRSPFDFGLFVAPVFTSPLVFGPILVAFQNASFDPNDRALASLSLLIIAFQNGFCWKEFFDNRRERGNHDNSDHST